MKEQYSKLSLFDKCLVHRYRYYIINEPLISDLIYDAYEKKAKEIGIPKGHSLSYPGSDIVNNYSNEIIQIALSISEKDIV